MVYVHICSLLNNTEYVWPVRIHMYFIRIKVQRYVQIHIICAIMYVSCTYYMYIHVQHGIHLTSTYLHVFCMYSCTLCTYLRTNIRTDTHYMCHDVCFLYVLYVHICKIRKTHKTCCMIRTKIRT